MAVALQLFKIGKKIDTSPQKPFRIVLELVLVASIADFAWK